MLLWKLKQLVSILIYAVFWPFIGMQQIKNSQN